jgi:cytochrome P450
MEAQIKSVMKPIPKRHLIPLITDLIEYRQAGKNTIAYTKKKIEKYGDVCEVSFTGIKNYFIHDPELIKEILTTQGPKMRRTYFFKAFRKFLGNGLFTSDGDFHKQQRKLIKPAFYPQMIEEYASIMVKCAGDETSTWEDGETVNINEAMTRITLQVITQTLFGSGLQKEVMTQVSENVKSSLETTNRILQNPFYVWCLINEIRIPIVRKFFKLRSELDKVIGEIISSYRKNGDMGKKDLLSMLMDARDEETGGGMSDGQVRDEVMTFFLAGHETTKVALTWTLYLIAKHPEIEKQFYGEVRTKIQDRLPKAGDYQSLSLTRNIFRESLRLYPPAWTFARAPLEDIEIQGYHFPKGCVLWTVTYLMHHNEKYFHDAEQFIPSRWDEEGIKEIPKYAWFPFGGGNRMCIGEGFAWMEGVLVLATIAGKFRLELPQGFTTEINPVFTLRPKDHVMMKVSRI